jgi:hypothetical protein
MPQVQKRTLQNDIVRIEHRLREIERHDGSDSEKYKAEQQKLVRLWAMLRLMHQKEAFLEEVLK